MYRKPGIFSSAANEMIKKEVLCKIATGNARAHSLTLSSSLKRPCYGKV